MEDAEDWGDLAEGLGDFLGFGIGAGKIWKQSGPS